MTKPPRQQGRKAPARGKTSAGPMTPAKGKGSYKRSKGDLSSLRSKPWLSKPMVILGPFYH